MHDEGVLGVGGVCFFSSRRRHTRLSCDWSSDVCSSDLPLGGNRKGRIRTHVNLMLTMLLGGLWHGASWNFVIWGGLHGSYLVAYHAWTKGRAAPRPEPSWPRRLTSMVLVYALVTFTWLFFRSHDLATTSAYLTGLFSFT